jgi:hypothetical protein
LIVLAVEIGTLAASGIWLCSTINQRRRQQRGAISDSRIRVRTPVSAFEPFIE